MALYEPRRHEPLIPTRWDPSSARAALESVVQHAREHYRPDRLWPIHPSDDDGGARSQKSTYCGAAGVVLALARLERVHSVPSGMDLNAVLDEVWAAYEREPDVGHDVPSLYVGGSGILLVKAALGRVDAERIERTIVENAENPTFEQLWGSPGTLLAAVHLGRMATEPAESETWRALFVDGARRLWRHWEAESDGVFVWEQDLYGSRLRYLGAAHGTAGNLFTLLMGAHWLDEDERSLLHQRTADFVSRRAHVDGALANWPPIVGEAKWLVQWCHGAPGIVTSLRPFPTGYSSHVEQLLVEAGELTWSAGPLTKGPSICHGTAGNGYALLQLFERTQDELWLDRARAFAMHAIAQIRERRERHGQGHFSLFTGDPGAALFIADCLDGHARFPLLDVLVA